MVGVLATAITVLVASALPAQASHFRGVTAVIEVELDGDQLAVDLTSLWRKDQIASFSSIWILDAADRSLVQHIPTTTSTDTTSSHFHAIVQQVGTVDISALPDGEYLVYGSSCCRIYGITNVGDTYFSVEAKFVKDGTDGGPPVMRSNLITAVGIGHEYSHNLNAVDPDGGPLTYEFLTDVADPVWGAPMFPGLSVSPKGQITIPAATTAGYTDGQLHVFKVRVTDSQGEYVDRDVMLIAFDTDNVPPVITDLDNAITVTAGETTTVEFTAPDANTGQTVTLASSGLPDFAELGHTPGNPAAGTLTFTPAAEDVGTTSGFNIEATDDDHAVPFTDSEFVEVTVVAPAAEEQDPPAAAIDPPVTVPDPPAPASDPPVANEVLGVELADQLPATGAGTTALHRVGAALLAAGAILVVTGSAVRVRPRQASVR